MATTHDFHRLYAALGLDADCGIDVFRQRMRRRIARLHPDRGGGGAVTEGPALDELLVLYAAARRFQRAHGRLPGASPRLAVPASAPSALGRDTPVVREPRTMPRMRPPSHPAASGDGRARTLAVLGIVAAVLAWLAARRPAEDAVVATPRPTPTAMPSPDVQSPALAVGARAPSPADKPSLAIGQDTDTVLALQGAPLQGGGDTWDYGPSWIRFSRGRVVDWSSSPAYPLRAETRTPPPDAGAGVHAGD